MIESPPTYKENITTIPLMVELQQNGILKKIQDDYLYWDKVKYKAEKYNPTPEQHHEPIFKQILGGCKSTVEGLGALRNKISDAHGKNKKIKPSAHHSELAVNLAGSMCKFLLETFKQEKK